MSQFASDALEPRSLFAAASTAVTLPLPSVAIDSVYPVDAARSLLVVHTVKVGKESAVNRYAAVRVNHAGSVDQSFGRRGVLSLPGEMTILAVDRRGGFLATPYSDGTDFSATGGLYWFNADGTLHAGFGDNGVARPKYDGQLFNILQARPANNGGAIVIGFSREPGDENTRHHFLLRLSADGSVRTAFGKNGYTFLTDDFSDSDSSDDYGRFNRISPPIEARDGAVFVPIVQADTTRSDGTTAFQDADLLMKRVLPGGTLDPTSTDGNSVNIQLDHTADVFFAGLTGNGRVVVETTTDGRVIRFTYDGTPLVRTQASEVVVASASIFGPGGTPQAARTPDGGVIVLDYTGLYRLRPDLSVDTGWGAGGVLNPQNVTTVDGPLGQFVDDGGTGVLAFSTNDGPYPDVGPLRVIRTDAGPRTRDIRRGRVVQDGDTLLIRGTTKADTIDVNIRKGLATAVSMNCRDYGLFRGVVRTIIDADDGNDTVRLSGIENADVYGGRGDDVLVTGHDTTRYTGNPRPLNRLLGQAGNDQLTTTTNNGPYTGGEGDLLDGGDGDDGLTGGSAHDTLLGGVGDDRLSGGAGSDLLRASAGNDRLTGGSEDDRLDAGRGNDTLLGSTGNDTLMPGAGRDRLDGGNGDDTVVQIYTGAALPTGVEYDEDEDPYGVLV